MKKSTPDEKKQLIQSSENQLVESGQPSSDSYPPLSDPTAIQLVKQALIASHNDPASLPIHGTVELFESMKPSDGIEGMLISQMLTVHSTAMTQLNKANSAYSSQQADEHRRMAIKLMNLLTRQALAFRKYRDGGEQRIQVEHVNIEKAAIGGFAK